MNEKDSTGKDMFGTMAGSLFGHEIQALVLEGELCDHITFCVKSLLHLQLLLAQVLLVYHHRVEVGRHNT
jgi:hypothetical protein